MLKKSDIHEVLLKYGVSIIEIERSTNSKEEFESCIKQIWEDCNG